MTACVCFGGNKGHDTGYQCCPHWYTIYQTGQGDLLTGFETIFLLFSKGKSDLSTDSCDLNNYSNKCIHIN